MGDDLPADHPFKDSQTLQELRGKGSRFVPPEFRRILFMTALLAVALGVIAWQASKRAEEMPQTPPIGASAPKEGAPLAQDDEVNRLFGEVSKGPPREAAEVAVGELLSHPEKHQGTCVRVSGIPIAMSADVLAPNPSGLAEAWRTYVVDRSTREAICVWTVEKPPDWDAIVLCHDVVEAEGVFVRLVTYTTQDGKERTAPLVVARSLGRVVYPEDTSVQTFERAIGGMMAIVGVVLFLLVRHGRREEARHKAQVREALGPAPPPPAEGGTTA